VVTKNIEDDPIIFETGHYKGAVVQRIVPAPWQKPFNLFRRGAAADAHQQAAFGELIQQVNALGEAHRVVQRDGGEDDPIIFETGHYKGAVVQRIVPAPWQKPFNRIMPVAELSRASR
jgi:hypothetical protein